MCQQGDDLSAFAGVGDDHISGAFVYSGVLHQTAVVQIGFQHIGPVQGHAHSLCVNAQTAAAFVQNGTFHIA